MRVSIHPHLLVSVQRQNLEKEFRDFLFLKYKWANSCFYNYSVARLAVKSGWSRNKVKRLVAVFIKQGWGELHSGNLIFKNTSKILATRLNYKSVGTRKNVFFECDHTQHDIFAQLNKVLLAAKIAQHKFIIGVKERLKNPADLAEHKKALWYNTRMAKKDLLKSEISPDIKISGVAMGKYLKRHVSTARRRFSLLIKDGLITYKRHTKILFRGANYVSFVMFKRNNPHITNVYLHGNMVIQRQSNSYTIKQQVQQKLCSKKDIL